MPGISWEAAGDKLEAEERDSQTRKVHPETTHKREDSDPDSPPRTLQIEGRVGAAVGSHLAYNSKTT